MKGEHVSAVRFASASRLESVAHGLARVATLIASDGARRTLLVEERFGTPGYELRLAAPDELAESVTRLLRGTGLDVTATAPWPAHLPPAPSARGAIGVLEPTAAEFDLDPVPPVVGCAPRIPNELWWALQGHLRAGEQGGLELWLRFLGAGSGRGHPLDGFGPALVHRAQLAGVRGFRLRALEPGGSPLREWTRGSVDRFRARWPLRPSPEAVGRIFSSGLPGPPPELLPAQHTVLFGASGSGKSRYLEQATVDRIRRGLATILVDVHGTLAPAVVSALRPVERGRVVAIDPTAAGPVPGIALLSVASAGREEAERAQLLAAFARLHAREGDAFWGFRLDRILDAFLALVQEEGGDLRDLAQLLLDPHRREAARLRTRSPPLRRFLDELPDLLRRNPEFLWSATSRLGRVLNSPRLMELVAPLGPPLPVPRLLASGRSLLLRLPIGELGPEGAEDLATLLLTRIYLDLTTRPTPGNVLFVLDEAHRVPGRLLAELLSEGRKFGVGVLAASQFPERLDRDARAAAAGAVSRHLLFQLPRAIAGEAGRWVGLPPWSAERILPGLASGEFVEAVGGDRSSLRLGSLPDPLEPTQVRPDAWNAAVAASRSEFAPEERPSAVELAEMDERLLLELFAGGTADEGVPESDLLRRTGTGEGAIPTTRTAERLRGFVQRGWVESGAGGVRLTEAGREALGITARTGAARESNEHRALLVTAARIFARHGRVLEILRQGRFDTQLPDARLRQLPREFREPALLAAAIDRARTEWAWRSFGGRDVFVEAEVSGAERPDRIRHGLRKGARAGAFVLFLVSTPRRARRVRAVLHAEGAVPRDGAVWTLGIPARGTGPEAGDGAGLDGSV